ncbi:hypothetical protein [Roseibium sp.]|uniref:hypothetical protein n=1 Tax=Roseibium sp. TaxID=1936156 RepID=UPI003A968F0E
MHSTSTDARLQHRLKKGESDILVVVFSQVRVPPGKFGLERLFAGTRHHCLFLNDTANGWYIGLDADIDALVEQAIGEVVPARIIYYGSSMGGYGAMKTGLRRSDGAIHAFGPELRPGRPGYQSSAYGVAAGKHDLLDTRQPDGAQRIDLYFGCLDPVDAANAAYAFDQFPSAHIHLLTSSHANHDHLYSLNIIRKIIRTFERDPENELAARDLLSDTSLETLATFGDVGEAMAAGSCRDNAHLRNLPEFDRNPGLMRAEAEILAMQDQFEAGVDLLTRAEEVIATDPVLKTLPKRWRKELPLLKVRWLQQAGKPMDAKAVLEQACATFPIDTAMRSLCGELQVPLPHI